MPVHCSCLCKHTSSEKETVFSSSFQFLLRLTVISQLLIPERWWLGTSYTPDQLLGTMPVVWDPLGLSRWMASSHVARLQREHELTAARCCVMQSGPFPQLVLRLGFRPKPFLPKSECSFTRTKRLRQRPIWVYGPTTSLLRRIMERPGHFIALFWLCLPTLDQFVWRIDIHIERFG